MCLIAVWLVLLGTFRCCHCGRGVVREGVSARSFYSSFLLSSVLFWFFNRRIT